MNELRGRLAGSATAFRAVAANLELRRLETAWAGSMLGAWAYSIAIAVFAYRHGGASAVGLVTLIRWLPAAAAAPFVSILGDRLSRRRVMLAADLVRVALLGGMAVVAWESGPTALIYALAACSAAAGTAFRPAQAALLPALARSPDELTAANVVSSTIESLGFFGGPALGGLLLAVTNPGTVFASVAGAFLWSAFNVASIRSDDRPEGRAREGILDEALAGLRTIVSDRRVRILVGLFSAQVLVDGALGVLVVVLALNRLGIGSAGLGYLNAMAGVGGVIGALVAAALIGRRRLAGDFGLGILIWGLPIALIGVWPNEAFALVMLAIVGAGNTMVDVAGMTLLQRGAPDEVLARVFGVMETMLHVSAGLGAVLAPVLYHAVGLRAALIVVGAILPAAALASASTLAGIDAEAAPAAGLERLLGVPFLALLPPPELEGLAGRLVRVHVAAGDDVFREGDGGDRFYVVDSGEVEILGARHGAGDYFGEIALLRDVPRTATVHAVTDVELLALERADFIAAVTGHAPAAAAADTVVGARLSPALSG